MAPSLRRSKKYVVYVCLGVMMVALVAYFSGWNDHKLHISEQNTDITIVRGASKTLSQPSRPQPRQPPTPAAPPVQSPSSSRTSPRSGDDLSKNKSGSLIVKVEPFPLWTTTDPKDSTFTRRVYVYSAVVAIHHTPPGAADINIITFHDGTIPLSLRCCLRHKDGSTHAPLPVASVYHKNSKPSKNPRNLYVIGIEFTCSFPGLSKEEAGESWVTLTSEICPQAVQEYTKVEVPDDKPEDIAICGKITYGYLLDAHRLVEWFEMQRLQGVSRVLIYALTNPEPQRSVFKHYQQMGMLDVLPYKLPGRPWNRTLLQGWQNPKVQYKILHEDSELIVWDCRLRLAGHKYVIGIDLDEVVMSPKYLTLRPFFDEQFERHPKVGSLFFNVQFFLDSWDKVDPSAPLKFLQYLNSTLPRWECQKYVYIPDKITHAQTHSIIHRPGASRYILPKTEATLHHYRACPLRWKSCHPKQMTDLSMLRYKDDLISAVATAKKKINL